MIITEAFINTYGLHAGLESMERDLVMLNKFHQGRLSVGAESLDDPTGSLVAHGMAAKYPMYFKVDAGLEGIGNLVDTLKKGIAGLRKLARGKAKAIITKQTAPIIAEVKKTYANSAWAEEQTSAKGSVSVAAVVKLIGGVKDFDEIVKKVGDLVKFYRTAVVDSEKETKDYWKKVEPFGKKAKNASKEDADNVISELAKAVPELPGKVINGKLPEYKLQDDNDRIFAISKENLPKAGALILSLFESANELEEIAETARINYGFGDFDFEDIPTKGLSDALYFRGFWEHLTWNVTEVAEDAAKKLLDVAKGVEQVILASIK